MPTSIRVPDPYEISVLMKLLECIGSPEPLMFQAQNCMVDDWGGRYKFLGFHYYEHLYYELYRPDIRGMAAECEALDINGDLISILLHVKNGRINLLEFYKPNGFELLGYPEINKIKCIIDR